MLLGAKDIAYPKINNLSFWLVPASFLVLGVSVSLEGAGTG